MTQALTDDDGRVRDLLEPAAGGGRLPPRVRRRPGRRRRPCRVLHEGRGRRLDRGHEPELPRAAPARAVLDDDVPRQLRWSTSPSSTRCRRPSSWRPSRRGSRARRGSSPGSRRRGRSATSRRCSARAAAIALAMPEAEQIELIDAHPRLGAPPATVSAAQSPRAGLRPRHDRGDRGARPPERRVRGAVRVPVLRLRQRPIAAGAGSRPGGGALRGSWLGDPARARATSWRSPATGPRRADTEVGVG